MKTCMIMSSLYDLNEFPYFRLNIASLKAYCKKWDIEFIYLDRSSELMKNFAECFDRYDILLPHLAKILRLNAFLQTDCEYGLFVDIDTNIINLHRDIRELIEKDKQYTSFIGPIGDRKKYQHHRNRVGDKINFSKFLLSNYPYIDNYEYLYLKSGFSIFNRDFCQKYLNFASEHNINIENQKDINNISSYVEKTINETKIKDTGHLNKVDDEFFLEAFILYSQTKNIKFDIVSLKESSKYILLEENDKVNLEKIIEYYPIFFHNGNISREQKDTIDLLETIKSTNLENSLGTYNAIRHRRYAELFEKRLPS